MIYDLKGPLLYMKNSHWNWPFWGHAWDWVSVDLRFARFKGWQSSESSLLPRMWHAFKSPHWCHMCVEFVVGSLLCLERFFSRHSCIPLYFINQHYQILILPGMVDEEPFMDVIPLNRYLLIITNKKSNWIPKTVLWLFHTTPILSHAQPQICQYTRLLLILMLTCKPVFSLAQTRRLSKSCMNLK